MAPQKLTNETHKMLQDFTQLNGSRKINSGTMIKVEKDDAKPIVENYLLGTSKMIERSEKSRSSMPRTGKKQHHFMFHANQKKKIVRKDSSMHEEIKFEQK